jgi:transcriptional regulator with XRE-family HTH domain
LRPYRRRRAENTPPPNRVRELRVTLGLTQKALAALCQPPLAISELSKIENGKRKWTYPMMQRLATPLGVRPADLLTEAGDMTVKDQIRELWKQLDRADRTELHRELADGIERLVEINIGKGNPVVTINYQPVQGGSATYEPRPKKPRP